MKRSNLQPGHLLTREERKSLRLQISDVRRRAASARDPEQIARLERECDSLRREQLLDRQVSPRSKRGKRGGQ